MDDVQGNPIDWFHKFDVINSRFSNLEDRKFQKDGEDIIIIINIFYCKCSWINHRSRGSKEILALLKLRTSVFYFIHWSNDPPPGIEPVTTGMKVITP